MTVPPRPPTQLQVTSLEEFTGGGEAVTLVVCTGALTKIDTGRLRDQLRVQLRHGPRHLLLDLSEIDGMDSVGVAMLTDIHLRARAARCTFDLVAPSGPVQSRLQLTGLHRLLRTHANLVDALTALEPPAV